MTLTYIPIASTTLSSSQSTVTFSSIPQTYTDLVLRFTAGENASSWSGDTRLTFNGSSSNVYSRVYVRGNSSVANSNINSSQSWIALDKTLSGNDATNTFGNAEIYIPNYTSTTTNKPISVTGVTEGNITVAGTVFASAFAALFSSTNAITSITLENVSGGFKSSSTFHLYGII